MALRPIKGDSARRYVDTATGEIFSRRAAMKVIEGVTPEEKRKARIAEGIKSHMGRYNAIVRDFKRMNPGEKVRGKNAGKFKEVIKGLKSKDNSKTGPKARALEAIGRRSREWRDYYVVGDSPA